LQPAPFKDDPTHGTSFKHTVNLAPTNHTRKDIIMAQYTRDERLAYDDGVKAARADKPDDCPFVLRNLANAWSAGWWGQQAEDEEDFEGMI